MPKYWKYFLQSSVLQRADEYLIIINIINAGIIVSDGSYCKSFCRALFKKVKELDIYSQAETVLSCLVIFKRQWDIKDFGPNENPGTMITIWWMLIMRPMHMAQPQESSITKSRHWTLTYKNGSSQCSQYDYYLHTILKVWSVVHISNCGFPTVELQIL